MSRCSAHPLRIAKVWLPIVAAVLVVAACNGSDDAADTTVATTVAVSMSIASPSTSTPTATIAPIPTLGGSGDLSNPVNEASAGAPTIKGATMWTSEDGTSALEVSPAWTQVAFEGSLGAWSVDDGVGTVNVVSDAVGEITTQDYLNASLEAIKKINGLELLGSGITLGPSGAEVGYIETRGMIGGPDTNHYLATFNLANGRATMVTLTAAEDRYAKIAQNVIPYLQTVRSF